MLIYSSKFEYFGYKLKVILILILLGMLFVFAVGSPKLVLNPFQITPLSPLYSVKLTREYMQSLFVFGDEDLANWKLTLSEKRLTEAEILKRNNQNQLTLKQLNLAKGYQQVAMTYIDGLRDKLDINYLLAKSEDVSKRISSLNN